MKIQIAIAFYLTYSLIAIAGEYNIELSNFEKITALTKYFVENNSKVASLQLPQKPKEPSLRKPPKLTKTKYEKIEIFEQRVKKEEEIYLNKKQKMQKQYASSLKMYDKKVQKIIQNYNNKNVVKLQKIKRNSKEKAYSVVYGNPYILKKSLVYDSQSQTFEADLKSTKGNLDKKILIKVSVSEAEEFEKKIGKMKLKVAFDLNDNNEKINYITIKSAKNSYIAKLK